MTRRIEGTTYPADRAPAGATRLPATIREWISSVALGVALRVLDPRPGEVVVIRGDRGIDSDTVRAINRRLHRGAAGDPVAVLLPADCQLHIEPAALPAEDRGYLETRTYGTDATAPDRGVYTGLPEE